MKANHLAGRTTAYIFFLAGFSILLFVAWQAYGMLTHPVPGLNLPHPSTVNASESAAANVDFGRMGTAALIFILKLAVLLLMTLVGSLIAARGIHLYHVASAPTSHGEPTAAASAGPTLALSDVPSESTTRAAGRQ